MLWSLPWTLLAPGVVLAAEPHQAATELLQGAERGAMPPAWFDTWLAPDEARLATTLRHALRPSGPVLQVLAEAPATMHVVDGPDYRRFVFETRPRLSLVVSDGSDGEVRVRTLEVTHCGDCDERTRFVVDLIADVATRGTLGERLMPHVELDLAAAIEQDRNLLSDHWMASMAMRLGTDPSLATRLSGAFVTRIDGDTVTLRYPDGSQDTWALAWAGDRWTIDYARLAGNSPLRLDRKQTRVWRSTTSRQRIFLRGWTPSWTPVDRGTGTVIGSQASDAIFHPSDGTVYVLVQDLDAAFSAVFHVDPATRQVLARVPLPLRSSRGGYPSGPWAERWSMALHEGGDRLLLTGPSSVWEVDVPLRQVRTLTRLAQPRVVSWGTGPTRDGMAWASGSKIRLDIPQGRSATLSTGSEVVGLHLDGEGRLTAALREGELVRFDGAASMVVARLCDGDVTAATANPDGTWLAACGERARAAWMRWGPLAGAPERGGVRGAGGSAVALAPSRRLALTAGPSHIDARLVGWDTTTEDPVMAFGATAVLRAAWSPDGDAVLTVDERGDVILYDALELRRRHGVLVTPRSGS